MPNGDGILSLNTREGVGPVRTVVVDDARFVVDLICRYLERHPGVDVVGIARNGREAVDRVVELRPDLVIMDVEMPGMNGLQATEAIKAQPDAPRIIIQSLYGKDVLSRSPVWAQVDGYCRKDRLHGELASAIARLFPGAAPAP